MRRFKRAEPTVTVQRRAHDLARENVIAAKDHEIDYLTNQVETLIGDRVTIRDLQGVTDRQDKTAEQLVRIEHAVFGVTGDNGINSKVQGLETGVESVRAELQRMREEEFKEVKQQLADTKDSIRRWALGLLPVLVGLVGIAVTIVAVISGAPSH